MTGPLDVLIRADASSSIGLGHAMRCFALAEALRDAGGRTAGFLMSVPPPAFVGRAEAAGLPVLALRAEPGSSSDASETAQLAGELGSAWVVIDGYHFGGAYQDALTRGAAKVLALDDHGHADHYAADLVLNQNLGADEALYGRRAERTELLLGSRHALLRREFRLWAEPRPPVPERATSLLVTLGGSDPDNLTGRVLDALSLVPWPLSVSVLVGAANPHGRELDEAARRCEQAVELVFDARDVPERMARADLAVAAAGGTSWELARIGTPQIAIVLADNQRPAGQALGQHQLAVVLGWHEELSTRNVADAVMKLADDHAARDRLARRGRELIDGRGADRVLARMGLLDRRAAALV